jgi:hypothetical protein
MGELRLITFYALFLFIFAWFSGSYFIDLVYYKVIKSTPLIYKVSPTLNETLYHPEKVGVTLGKETIPNITNISDCRACIEVGGVWRWCGKRQVIRDIEGHEYVQKAWCQPTTDYCGAWDWGKACWNYRIFWKGATSCATTFSECVVYEELR